MLFHQCPHSTKSRVSCYSTFNVNLSSILVSWQILATTLMELQVALACLFRFKLDFVLVVLVELCHHRIGVMCPKSTNLSFLMVLQICSLEDYVSSLNYFRCSCSIRHYQKSALPATEISNNFSFNATSKCWIRYWQITSVTAQCPPFVKQYPYCSQSFKLKISSFLCVNCSWMNCCLFIHWKIIALCRGQWGRGHILRSVLQRFPCSITVCCPMLNMSSVTNDGSAGAAW